MSKGMVKREWKELAYKKKSKAIPVTGYVS
jgi:hypothetical protein